MPVKISMMNQQGSADEAVPPDSRRGPGRPQTTTVVYQMPRGPPQLSRVAGTGSAPPPPYGYGAPPPQHAPQVPYQRAMSGSAPPPQQPHAQFHGGPPPTAQSAPGADRRYGPPQERYVERMEEDVRPQPGQGQGRIIREINTGERMGPSAVAVRGNAPPPEAGAVVYAEGYDPSEERVTYVRQTVPGYSTAQPGQYEIVHRVSSSPSTSPSRGERDSYGQGHPPNGPQGEVIARGRSYTTNSNEPSETRPSPPRRPASGPAPAGPPREGEIHHPHMPKTRTIVLQGGPYPPSHESSAPPESQRIPVKVQTTSAAGPSEIRRVPEGVSYEVRTRAPDHPPVEHWREEGHPPPYGPGYEHHPRPRSIGENPPSSRSPPARFVYSTGHPSHPAGRPMHGDEYGPGARQYYYEEYSHPRQQLDGHLAQRVSFEREVEYQRRQQDPHFHQRQRPMARDEIAAEHQPPPPPPKGTRMVVRTVLGVNNARLLPDKDSAGSAPTADHGGAPSASIPNGVGSNVGESAPKTITGKPSSDNSEDSANMGCTCKKSKCLKLYCQCFASKIMCGPNCRCLVCMNTVQYEQVRKDAINAILSRNPNAFDTKFKATSGTGTEGDGEEGQTKVAHKLGCKCRKSACLKKYCECYHANVKCSTNCRCVGCQNMPPGGLGGPKKPEEKVSTKADSNEPSMDEAVHNLTSLKNASAEVPERSSSMSSVKVVPPVTAVTSDEAESSVNEPSTPAKDAKMSDVDHSNSDSKSKQVIGKQSTTTNTEKNAGEGVNTLLMAAFAMTEMHKGNTPPGSPQTGPKKEPSKDAEPTELPQQKPVGIMRQGTPDRRTNKAPYRSPKRKSSEDSDDGSSENGSRKKYHYNPDSTTKALSNYTSSPSCLQVDSRSDVDAVRQKQMRTHESPPATTPEQRKVKRSRLGSAKKAFRGGKQVHPLPFPQNGSTGENVPIKAENDVCTTQENSYGTPERDSPQHSKGVGDTVDHTPRRTREAKDALTPVSARCMELRKMEVNPDSGRRVGFDLEKEGRAEKHSVAKV